MKIGLGQIDCKLGDIQANLDKMRRFISMAREEGVNLLIFPELSLTGYSVRSLVPDMALEIESPIIEDLKNESKDISLVVGFIEESKDYNFYNSALYLEEGKIKHIHRKIYLPTYGIFDEKKYFAPGKKMRAFETVFGRMAILTCADSWHPILSNIAALDGAFIFIHPAAIFEKALGNDVSASITWDLLNRFYAQLFSNYVIFVNRVGFEEGRRFWGHSALIAPGGRVIVKAKYHREQLVTASIDKSEVRRYRTILPEFRDEKIDLDIKELQRVERRR